MLTTFSENLGMGWLKLRRMYRTHLGLADLYGLIATISLFKGATLNLEVTE